MAKHCDVCNKSYPETEARCPHCAAAEKAATGDSGSAVNLGDPHVAELADSGGNLSGPPSPQSPSHVAWASLVEEVPDDAPKIDSPSDRDILANAPDTPPPSAGHAAAGEEPFVAESASNVDLAGGPFVADVADDSTSAIDLAALAGQSASGSSLHGSAAAQPAGEAAQPEPDAMATEVDTGDAPPAARGADGDDTHFLDDVAEVEAGSAVNLGEAARPTDRPSSRDLIAEAVESGVDVGGARAAGEAATEHEGSKPPSRHEIDPDDEESSSDRVDLGSHETEALAEGPVGPSSEVDLGGKAGRARRRQASQPTSDVDLAGARAEGEEAEEGAEQEEAAPVRAEEQEKRSPKARSGAGCALVGGALGLLIGVGSAFGLWLFGVEPPAGWKLAETKPPANALRQQPAGPQPGAAAPAAANPAHDLKNGDFAKVVTDLAQAPEPTPEVLAQRGTARWMQYLQEQKTKNAALKADDEAVKQARTDLETAAQKDNTEALLALGNLQEWTGAPADAAKTYQDGLKRFGGNARWARVFQAQLNRLESASAAAADGGKPGADLGRPGAGASAAAEALVALLLAFQADQTAAEDDEAGFEFWAAVKSAQAGDYAAACKALDAARKAHDKMRFTRLRKAQNPLSDPTEEIFLRSAKEIEAYWALKNYLMQQNILAKGDDPQKAIAAAVQGSGTLQAQLKKVADNLGTTPDKLGTAVDALVKEKEEAAKKATALTTDLAAAKKDSEAAKKETKDLGDKLAMTGEQLKAAEGKLKNVGDRLAAAGIKDPDPAKGIDTLAAERTAADKTLGTVAEKLAAANVKGEKKDVVQGVERLISVAQEKDPKGELTASRTEIKRLEGALAQRRTPGEMLDVWLAVLADRTQKANAPKAIADAERAENDPKANAETRGKVLAVVGLARRNLGDYVAAGNLLHNSLRVGGEKGDWQPAVTKALKELTDPNAYYLPRAHELYEEGKSKEALDLLTEMEKVLPNDAAAALPLRSLMHLELARKDGKVDAASPHVAEARKDAGKAAAAGNAEGNYVLGLIAEQLGDPAGAQGSYAKALAAHADKDEAGLRYRIALARVLKLQASKPAGAQAYLPRRRAPVADGARQPLAALLLLVELSFQAAGPEQDEVMKLADEVLAAKDGPDTFLYKAQALALKGLWTPALQTYAAGLRGHVRRDYADTLAGLVAGHPALRRPSSLDQPNPLLAEAHYAAGLRAYFGRRFVEAQSAFAAAIQSDGQDARYFYFLGLTRLALDNREEANADFEEGSRLERDNRPGRKVVSTALERVQGPARQALNRFRP